MNGIRPNIHSISILKRWESTAGAYHFLSPNLFSKISDWISGTLLLPFIVRAPGLPLVFLCPLCGMGSRPVRAGNGNATGISLVDAICRI
jgi:hypothetical protein